MNPFKQLYVLLSVILLGGIGGALVTPLGGDPRIGNISAGVSVGILFCLLMIRLTHLKLNKKTSLNNIDFHGGFTGISADLFGTQDGGGDAQEDIHLIDLQHLDTRPQSSGSSPGHSAEASEGPRDVSESEYSGEPSTPVITVELRCSCVCDCAGEAKAGFEGLCAECRTGRLQELLICSCDYSTTPTCECGVLSHWPEVDEADQLQAS